MTSLRVCELCDREASVYCTSDAAFLCSNCDARVHGANFLVARHLRHPICSQCHGFAAAGSQNPRPVCNSCSPETFSGDGDSLSEASSACISSTESFATKSGFDNRQKSESSGTEVSGKILNIPARLSGRFTSAIKKKRKNRVETTEVRAWMDAKAEGTFVNWCNKLALNGNSAAGVVSSASKALTVCLGRLTGVRRVPLRVSLAASFWFGLRFCGDRALYTCQNLRRVEEVSGVPVKLILAVEAQLGRELTIRRARRDDLEEGWAEC